jgi:type IV pilus assembly protein PilY1
VIADVTIVRDNAGQAIYGYTADLGGDVYRITFGNGTAASDNSASWSMTKIASLGCGTTAACTANRKFMFAPSVVAESGDYSIMIGTGDREKPLTYFAAAGAVPNFFFKFTDKPTVLAATYPGTGDCGTAIICLSSLLAITGNSTPSATDLAAKKGWYLGMTSSEQVVTSAVTIFGTVNFSTHQPAVAVTGSCKPNLGVARSYNVKYTDAASTNGTNERFLDIIGGGLSPSPVAGQVTIDGKTVPFCIGCTNEILKPKLPTSSSGGLQPKGRLYWYIQK